jgi:hypothetical protein
VERLGHARHPSPEDGRARPSLRRDRPQREGDPTLGGRPPCPHRRPIDHQADEARRPLIAGNRRCPPGDPSTPRPGSTR